MISIMKIKPGDVLVKVETGNAFGRMWRSSTREMLEALKTRTTVNVEVVRNTKFDAKISKFSGEDSRDSDPGGSRDRLMDVVQVGGRLLIEKLSPSPSGRRIIRIEAERYNVEQFKKPLVSGDIIVAVDGTESLNAMIEQMEAKPAFTLSVVRGWQ